MSCLDCGRKCQRFGKHRNGLRRFRCPTCRKTFTEPHERTLGTMYIPQAKALLESPRRWKRALRDHVWDLSELIAS